MPGAGMMRAAAAQAVKYAFDQLDLHTVSAWTIGPNQSSAEFYGQTVSNASGLRRRPFASTAISSTCFGSIE